MRTTYEVRWCPRDGKCGGLGAVRKFRTSANSPGDAARKLRGAGVVRSVRKAEAGKRRPN